MKKLLLIAALFLTNNLVFGQTMQFTKGTWAEIVAKAKSEKKMIFVDVTADWCFHCKRMEKLVFTLPEVAEQFNKHFINVQFDFDKDFVKGAPGPASLLDPLRVFLPTYFFFDADGKALHRKNGFTEPKDFVELSKQITDTTFQYYPMKARFAAGERDKDFLYKYLTAVVEVFENPDEAATAYFNLIPKEEWISTKNFKLFLESSADFGNARFQEITKQPEKFQQYVRPEDYKALIALAIENSAYVLRDSKTSEQEKKDFRKKVAQAAGKDSLEMLALTDFNQYIMDESIFEHCEYLDKYCNSATMLNSYAWQVFESKSPDKNLLKRALAWVDKSIALEKTYAYLDTKAHILHKMGNSKQAKKCAEEAIQLAEKTGENTESMKTLLKSLQKK